MSTVDVASVLLDQVGKPPQRSRSVELTQERVTAFGVVTEDMQWIHTDPERAGVELGGTLAHGMLVAALIPGLVDEVIEAPDCDRVINLGFDRLSFAAPVPVGSAICLDAKVIDAQPGTGRVDVRCDVTVWLDAARPRVCAAGVLRLRFIT
ncbi:MaoC/PaaZ C-terminal domain-containing protein [Nocardia sp. XZ_19_369]|uniref:MaoC/PaaZ C-terminal domain-containing protein n=1 Tax=Nocardia sp. XZ_19_369 TaxID=2769487 RepID=UPI00188FE5E1|nr:MaoC/PaaZ C-terminal domain-containing protein [Nocardia sp. XZ_19_369]